MADLRKRAGKVRDLDVQTDLLGHNWKWIDREGPKDPGSDPGKEKNRQAKRLESAVKKIQESKFFTRMERIAEQPA